MTHMSAVPTPTSVFLFTARYRAGSGLVVDQREAWSSAADLVGNADDSRFFLTDRLGNVLGRLLHGVDVAAEGEDRRAASVRVDALDHVLVQEELVTVEAREGDHGIEMSDWSTVAVVATVFVLAS